MNSEILCLNDSNFNKNVIDLSSKCLFLVDFWAEWCNPCKIISSVLDDVAKEYIDKLRVAKCNIDESPITTRKYGIRSIPTLLLFKYNEVISTKIGVLSKGQLREFLNVYL
ncbi:thioredoxin [Blochmannia endosymbiont of Colobopsis nipponica]|uniref:thioredoxin n=1 Tax=Blochmannia endosymbiont of Colobopsis nipponica TaxID=2681987 RepID=UPI001781AC57|nr:thioredoxin [Blochmannia endosymbiont of Colobopsis nipponica]QOI10882.1 thioredoxin [Blochmannia endosymbiont of Colobopsis nipponica]QOI10892.1 thioredoxin [Blochmannia endosymbiont of Colobopsis nipponica]